MALLFTEIASFLGRFLIPTVVRRIMGDVEERRHRWEFGSREQLFDYLQQEIRKEREKEPVVASTYQISEKAECQVCKSPVTIAEATCCAKCGIPYHPDCFELMRSCSIFGCGGGK